MKVIVLSLFLAMSCAYSRSESSPVMTLCRNLEMDISSMIDHGERGYPAEWGDFPIVDYWRRNADGLAIDKMRMINSLALIPGGYLLGDEAPPRFRGSRVMIVSRAPESGKGQSDADGRYLVFIDKENRAMSSWLEEKDAEKILKLMEGFDPVKAPLVFQNISSIGRERQEERRKIHEQARQIINGLDDDLVNDGAVPDRILTDESDSRWGFGVVLGILLLVCGIYFWRFIRSSRA